MQILEDIKEKYPEVIFSDDSGIKQIQLRAAFDKWELLHDYYNLTNN